MARVLITGGAGFLGFHLAKAHMAQGDEIICLDNLHTGQISNIDELKEFGKIEFIEHDVIEPFKVEANFAYNLACPASPVHYQLDPIATIKSNIMGSINILDNSRMFGMSVLQSSTSEIYGNPQIHPQDESYWGNVNTIGIRSCYDEGKRVSETLFSDYRRQYDVDSKIARIFNTYGPNMRMDDGRVVSNFILQALRNDEITMYGRGSQTRSFCYVDDLIAGLMLLGQSPKNIMGPYNIGNPTELTMLELASLIIRLTDSKSQIVFKELPQDDPDRRNPDISKMREDFDWQPKVQVEEGLLRTITYFDRKLSQ